MEEQANDWTASAAARTVEVIDYGLWIDGEMLSEKDEMEGTTND